MRKNRNADELDYTVWQLASMADCASPTAEDSAGGKFLRSVADRTAEQIEAYREERTSEDRYDYSGELAEIADGAPDVYTYQMWKEFVDLCAYREDPSELGADSSDMDQCARVCLYVIADRLVRALVDEAGPFDEDDEDGDES